MVGVAISESIGSIVPGRASWRNCRALVRFGRALPRRDDLGRFSVYQSAPPGQRRQWSQPECRVGVTLRPCDSCAL
jgi:hypothetical protein